jgi:hypothetical protein
MIKVPVRNYQNMVDDEMEFGRTFDDMGIFEMNNRKKGGKCKRCGKNFNLCQCGEGIVSMGSGGNCYSVSFRER